MNHTNSYLLAMPLCIALFFLGCASSSQVTKEAVVPIDQLMHNNVQGYPSATGNLTMPTYPTSALGHGQARVVISAKIEVSPEGRVAQLTFPGSDLPLPSDHSEDFRASIKSVVASWHLLPAKITTMDQDPVTGAFLMGEKPVQGSIELQFKFEPSGKVSAVLTNYVMVIPSSLTGSLTRR